MSKNRIAYFMVAVMLSFPASAYYVIVDDDASLSAVLPKEKKPVPAPAPVERIVVADAAMPPMVPSIPKPKKQSKTCPIPASCGIPDNSHNMFYDVPFFKKKAVLTKEARERIDSLIPLIRKGRVCIVGRPDAIVFTNGKFSRIARHRAQAIRTYLTRNGVNAGTITVGYKDSPNPQSNGTIYPSELIINIQDDAVIPPGVPEIRPNTSLPVPAGNAIFPTVSPASSVPPAPDQAPATATPAEPSNLYPDELKEEVIAPKAVQSQTSLKKVFPSDHRQVYQFIAKSMYEHKIDVDTGYQLIRLLARQDTNAPVKQPSL